MRIKLLALLIRNYIRKEIPGARGMFILDPLYSRRERVILSRDTLTLNIITLNL